MDLSRSSHDGNDDDNYDDDDDNDDDVDQKRRKSQILNSCPASRSIHRSDLFSNNSTYRKTQLFICKHTLTPCSTHKKDTNLCLYYAYIFCHICPFHTCVRSIQFVSDYNALKNTLCNRCEHLIHF